MLGELGPPVPGEEDEEWPRRSVTLTRLRCGLPVLLRLLRDNPYRWIVGIDPGPDRWYLQFLATEEQVLVAECVSNESMPRVLSVDQDELLPTLGWEWPAPPNKPNYSRSSDLPEAAGEYAALALRTLDRVFGVEDDDVLRLRVFPSTHRPEGPLSADREH